jgi:hypothetical protein
VSRFNRLMDRVDEQRGVITASHAAGERVDVERLRILPVHPVANTAQLRELPQVRCGRGGSAGHLGDRATARGKLSNAAGNPTADLLGDKL